MHQPRVKHWLFLFVLIIVLFFINVSLGSVSIPASQVWAVLSGAKPDNQAWAYILLEFRLPKAITAVAVGIGLSISGLQMQTLFRNPLAGPFVLGITSGASLGVALLVLAGVSAGGFLGYGQVAGSYLQVIAATAGASLVMLLVIGVSLRVKDSMTLLIIGLMFGSATGALVSVLQFFSTKHQIQAYLIWTFGNLGGLSWEEISVFLPVLLAGTVLSFFLTKPLNALLLGENYARSMGLNLRGSRFLIIAATSILAGTVTAFCGPIAFVGIAVPHLTRLLFNTSDHRILIPAVSLSGAILMLACDIIAQLPGSESTLPINAITCLLGAPVVIWVILRKRNISRAF